MDHEEEQKDRGLPGQVTNPSMELYAWAMDFLQWRSPWGYKRGAGYEKKGDPKPKNSPQAKDHDGREFRVAPEK